MKIAVESSPLLVRNKTGVDLYIQRIIQALLELDRTNRYQLVYMAIAGRARPKIDLEAPNLSTRRISWFPGKAYNLSLRLPFGLPIDLLAGVKPDIFFFPNFIRWPLLWTRRSVVAVYDLSYLHASEHAVQRHRWYLTKFVPRSIKKASRVITISENAKREIIKEYGTAPDKISVIYPAVDHNFFKPAARPAVELVKQKYAITQPYIMCLATMEPRKNLVGLLKAYDALDEQLKKSHALVLAGGKGWLSGELNRLYADLSRRYSIIRTGYVDEADLPALLSGAEVFAFPAFYEGFGMPPLEAMSCGTPVVVGDNSSLPEVVGEAGLKVDVRDTAAIAGALTKVLTDKKLARKMSEKGLVQAGKFEWSREAAKLMEVFQDVGRQA